MTKEREALKLALEYVELVQDDRYNAEHIDREALVTAIKEALAQPEPWEKFCDSNCVWTDHHPDCKLAEQSTECGEPVATDWERIARVQDAKLRAMCNEAGGFEKLCEVMDKYERTTPPQRKPLTDEEFRAILRSLSRQQGWDGDGWDLALKEAIEAAHGIYAPTELKGEA